MVVYLAAMVLALRLPDRVASPPAPASPPHRPGPPAMPNERGRFGPRPPGDGARAGGPRGPGGTIAVSASGYPPPLREPARPGPGRRWRTLRTVGPVVAEAMSVNTVLRAFSGYTFFFFAFLLQSVHFGVSKHVALAALALAVAAGSAVAMAIGSVLRSRAPQLIMYAVLTVAPVVAAAAAWLFGLAAVMAVAFAAICRASLAKLAQDSIVQREIGDELRSSAFGVSGLRDAEPGGERGGRPVRRAGVDARQRPRRAWPSPPPPSPPRWSSWSPGAGAASWRDGPRGDRARRPPGPGRSGNGPPPGARRSARRASRRAAAQGSMSSARARSTAAIFRASLASGCLPRR
jgi:hypothetical protein